MQCPSCRTALQMTERQGVEIDYCPQCRGVWLDRGELDKILERAGAERGAPSPSGFRGEREEERPWREEHRERRKRNWLEDLFD